MNAFKSLCALLIFHMFFTSCAFDLVHVKQFPAQLDPTQQRKNPLILEEDEKIDLGTGYSRILKAGTKWDYVGTIERGDVFNTKDQVLTVEASNIHEAYIVISSGKLVGFYLPVEKIIIFSSCATSGPKYVELKPSMPVVPDTGRIFLYRDSSLGAAIQPDVKINGEVVGSSIPYGFFYVNRSLGAYEIMTSTEVDRKLSLTLDKGQIRFVRLNISMGFFAGHVYPELVDQVIGEKEIQECRYTGK